jgi:hypothetical protein
METWPARSLDFTPLDFSIFGFLKTKFFKEKINNLQELMARITLKCNEIKPDIRVLQHVYNNETLCSFMYAENLL